MREICRENYLKNLKYKAINSEKIYEEKVQNCKFPNKRIIVIYKLEFVCNKRKLRREIIKLKEPIKPK